jgi:peptidoglycan hydrolase-like protein with peptidoglycan-binding domain
MTRTARRRAAPIVPLVAAVLVLLATVGDAAGLSTYYPVQSLGNRGSDVRTIQYLLRHAGQTPPVDGVFAPTTQAAVAAHQAGTGLPVTGVVDEPTWRSLTPRLTDGDTGDAVRALQRLLNEKRRTGLTVDGVYGAATHTAIASFQRHMGATATGSVDPVTWRRLLWHFEYPVWGGTTGLCDYSDGNGWANWGTGAALGQVEAAGKRIYDAGHGRVALGDIGWEHGGDIPGHQTHEDGLDLDIRPMRHAENQCAYGTTWRRSTYDRSATRSLIKAIRATAPGHVKLIYFNDPVLIGEGLTTWYTGHDDHLHVRYCEPWHPVSMYRCAAAPLPPE